MQQTTIEFESAAKQQPIDRGSLPRPLQWEGCCLPTKKNVAKDLQDTKSFVSLQCQTQKCYASDEWELANHPNILGAFQPANDIDGCLPSGSLLFGSDATEFDDTEAQPSLRPYQSVTGNVKLSTIMATLSIQRRAQRRLSIKEWAKGKSASVIASSLRGRTKAGLWLDTKSEFYSRICEFTVTRRLVVRVNVVSLCMILAAISIEQQPLVAITAAVTSGWLVYRLNAKEGDRA